MRCWVIMGNCGEYSDHCDWVVGAFVAESAARAYLGRLETWAREHNMLDGSQVYPPPDGAPSGKCPLDINVSNGDGVWWEIHETELHGGGAVNV